MRPALFAMAFVAASAWADAKHPNPFLSQAKAFFASQDGEKCLKRLLQADQKWKHNDKKDRAEIELYGGLCGYLIGETQAAEVSFKNAIKIDPKLNLPPDVGPGIETLWVKATGKAPAGAGTGKDNGKVAAKAPDQTKPPEKQPDNPPPPPPPKKEEPVVARNDTPQKTVLTPEERPQVEQELQPKKKSGRNVVVPVILGAAAIGAATAGIIFGLQAKSLEAQFKDPMTFYMTANTDIAPRARMDALLANILFGSAGALAIAGLCVLLFTG
jgi:hypothetical protein